MKYKILTKFQEKIILLRLWFSLSLKSLILTTPVKCFLNVSIQSSLNNSRELVSTVPFCYVFFPIGRDESIGTNSTYQAAYVIWEVCTDKTTDI